MSTDPRIEAAAKAIHARRFPEASSRFGWNLTYPEQQAEALDYARAALAAAEKAATIDPCVEHFINERPGYIQALKDTRGTDDQSDYWRWQGHAEARRQLATVLGYTVPHEPGETTKRGTE